MIRVLASPYKAALVFAAAALWYGFSPVAAAAGEVKEVVSDGGITAWLVEEHSLPLIAVRAGFEGAGFAYDGEGREGRANLTAALLTEGAGDLDDRALNQALESRAIVLNASVDEDLLEVSMQTLSEHRDAAFSYLGLALADSRFDSSAVDRAGRQALALLKAQEQNPGYLAARAWRKAAFGDHPYGRMALGTEKGLSRLDRYDLKNFAGAYLTRGNLLVAVVGDITPEELKPLLDKTFGKLPQAYKPDVTVADVTVGAGEKPKLVEYSIPQTWIKFGGQGIKRDDPDYLAAHVMNQILGGESALASRLGIELREKRGLTYGASSVLRPLAHAALWEGVFATRNEEAGQAMTVLRETLETFSKTGPTAREVADAKRYIIGSLAIHLDNNDALAGFLIVMRHQRLGRDYLEKRAQLLEAVGRAEVKAMAKRLLDTGKLIMVMVGKPALETQ